MIKRIGNGKTTFPRGLAMAAALLLASSAGHAISFGNSLPGAGLYRQDRDIRVESHFGALITITHVDGASGMTTGTEQLKGRDPTPIKTTGKPLNRCVQPGTPTKPGRQTIMVGQCKQTNTPTDDGLQFTSVCPRSSTTRTTRRTGDTTWEVVSVEEIRSVDVPETLTRMMSIAQREADFGATPEKRAKAAKALASMKKELSSGSGPGELADPKGAPFSKVSERTVLTRIGDLCD